MIRKLFHVPVVLRDSRTFFSGLRSRVTVIASDEAYSHIAKEGTGRKAIVYFTAKWCPPCKIIGPIYDELSVNYKAIDFAKLDVDDLHETTSKAGVRVCDSTAIIIEYITDLC